ncbi:uncharacterized protein [Epargyreus clarus]
MLSTGALSDVTLSASGTCVKAHRLVLASCSQYFAQLFKEIETENNTLVIVLGCEAVELNLLLTFMYTGEVTASKKNLPSLLRLAQTLKVSGLTDSNTNSTLTPTEPDQTDIIESPTILDKDEQPDFLASENSDSNKVNFETQNEIREPEYTDTRVEKDRLSKLHQIVQNLYSTHKIGNVAAAVSTPTHNLDELTESYDRKWRTNSSVCTICNKRLSNQYNLRVHMETHAGRRHACRACSHVSRSRDALRKHVAYRHAPRDRRDV